ncbi:MAG: hypothetical protein LHW41_02545 [Candidatus Cloacimonetes bacterium]|jgi:hypothetical protein|nr:hypothetical protein [Candidatus Cloacimonadota bacterium]
MTCTVDWNAVATGSQALILIIGFYFTHKQLKHQTLDSKARTIIDLKRLFHDYLDVTIALRPGGRWSEQVPEGAEAWGAIDNYLGLFEHCEYLISMNMIDLDFFRRSHSVKLMNAVLNKPVRNKIQSERKNWIDLLHLCQRLNIEVF